MPPNRTFGRVTLGSSVRSGVYSGISVTSWPLAISSVASALSWRQLPQYIPPAPAVMERIFIDGRPPPLYRRGLERAGAEQEIDDVALVRLQPVELNRRHRSEIQSID